jgi:hypothetical protein
MSRIKPGHASFLIVAARLGNSALINVSALNISTRQKKCFLLLVVQSAIFMVILYIEFGSTFYPFFFVTNSQSLF